jgi:hypothetical protein
MTNLKDVLRGAAGIADYETLMRQAPMTAEVYLMEAVECIDKQLGEGFAKNNPELIGDFIKTCAIDYHAGVLSKVIEELAKISTSAL